jgi:hypothetical protein
MNDEIKRMNDEITTCGWITVTTASGFIICPHLVGFSVVAPERPLFY